MRAPAPAALVLLALLAGACSGGDDEGDAVASTTAAESTTVTTGGATSTTLDPEGIAGVESLAQSLLIRGDELAASAPFQDVGFTPRVGPNVCGFDLDAEFPSLAHVGTGLGSESLGVIEEIRVYEDPAAATAAYDGALASLCPEGDEGTAFGEPADVTERVGGEAAVSIPVTAPDGTAGVVVVAVVRDALVNLGVQLPAGESPTDPLEVAAFAVGKILAALGD